MVKVNDLKPGDLIRVLEGGMEREGTVVDVSRDENMVCIDNGVQEFWYTPEELAPIPLSEEQLMRLGFEREDIDRGAKFKKGPFRILLPDPGNYTNMEIWYREDHRHFHHPLYVHELQNHHLDMTKVTLEKAVAH
ncbi:MAG TPA: hypothetical protein VHK69_07745 [Chitinophagaceae bacterium]|jgi:hypothetical protein|nr:hypothetical protein [Chitinophagaceae bacterium]